MKIEEMVAAIISLPIDARAKVVDEILQSFHQIDPDIEKAWAEEAERRLEEYKQGKVKLIPGEEVFDSIRKRLSES